MSPKGVDGSLEEWQHRVQQDISDLRQKQSENEGKLGKVIADVHKLEVSDQLQNKDIDSLQSQLSEIKADTGFIRTRMDSDRDEQLKQYKNMTWKIVGAIIIAGVLAFFGLQ